MRLRLSSTSQPSKSTQVCRRSGAQPQYARENSSPSELGALPHSLKASFPGRLAHHHVTALLQRTLLTISANLPEIDAPLREFH
jgi:hypothetical protein